MSQDSDSVVTAYNVQPLEMLHWIVRIVKVFKNMSEMHCEENRLSKTILLKKHQQLIVLSTASNVICS